MNFYNYPKQYALKRISAIEANSITGGSDKIRIGIIDSGIYPHENLLHNISWGWNFIDNNKYTNNDITGHGTNIAGIIGASPYKNECIGVCKNVSLVPLKVIDGKRKLDETAVIAAIDYAAKNNISIINYCYSVNDYNEKLANAIKSFKGLFICSAGNEAKNIDINKKYPASLSLSNMIVVAASQETDSLSEISNYGKNAVHLGAPGDNIFTTHSMYCNGKKFIVSCGTSLATPYVTAVAALIQTIDTKADCYKIKETILSTVDKVLMLSGKIKSGGRLNAYKALEKAVLNKAYNEK